MGAENIFIFSGLQVLVVIVGNEKFFFSDQLPLISIHGAFEEVDLVVVHLSGSYE
ncbi:hypothetical protein D3C87_1296380 [compost metagenome]